MRERLTTLARSIHQPLLAAEKAHDETTLHTARLVTAMFEAHDDLRFNFVVGAELIDSAGAMLASQLEERRRRVEFHHKLAEFKSRTALRTVDIGGAGDKEDLVAQPLFGLRAVPDAAAA